MKINRTWSMPNKETFKIKPIKELLDRYVNGRWVDPYAGYNSPATIQNDLNLDIKGMCFSHKEATIFLKEQLDNSCDGVLFDPPYSPRQLSESYKKFGLSVNMQTTQSSYWSKCRKEIARIIKPEGICISFGWNSCGIGKKLGFKILEILLVSHGGGHNDTIVTVERKDIFNKEIYYD